jgi:hypothetical protein
MLEGILNFGLCTHAGVPLFVIKMPRRLAWEARFGRENAAPTGHSACLFSRVLDFLKKVQNSKIDLSFAPTRRINRPLRRLSTRHGESSRHAS